MLHDRNKVLDRLQAVLKDESVASQCYQIHADEIRKTGHERLARRLESIANDHRRHMHALQSRIRDMGAKPRDYQPPDSLLERMRSLPRQDLCVALEHDLKAEDTEIEEYAMLSHQSDAQTAQLCSEFSSENRGHVAWLRDELTRGLNLEREYKEGEDNAPPPNR